MNQFTPIIWRSTIDCSIAYSLFTIWRPRYADATNLDSHYHTLIFEYGHLYLPKGTVNEIMATANVERTFIRVNESDSFVEICVVFRGLGITQNAITIIIFTRDGSAIGMSHFVSVYARLPASFLHGSWKIILVVITFTSKICLAFQ